MGGELTTASRWSGKYKMGAIQCGEKNEAHRPYVDNQAYINEDSTDKGKLLVLELSPCRDFPTPSGEARMGTTGGWPWNRETSTSHSAVTTSPGSSPLSLAAHHAENSKYYPYRKQSWAPSSTSDNWVAVEWHPAASCLHDKELNVSSPLGPPKLNMSPSPLD